MATISAEAAEEIRSYVQHYTRISGTAYVELNEKLIAMTEPEPVKPDIWNGWTPKTLVEQLRKEMRLINVHDQSGWRRCYDELKRILEGK